MGDAFCKPVYPIYPPVPVNPIYEKDILSQIYASFISVDTIEDRDALNPDVLSDGKIVRVNNVDGESKYYVYVRASTAWANCDLVTVADIEELSKSLIWQDIGQNQ